MTQPTVSLQSVTAGGFTRTQLEVIKTFGRKEVSFGCLIKNTEYEQTRRYIRNWDGMYIVEGIGNEDCWHPDFCEILGHIPHLEDVFRVAKEKWWLVNFTTETNELLFYRKDSFGKTTEYKNIAGYKTIPLIEQPESVLIQILNLFK